MHKLAICKIGGRISFGKVDKDGNVSNAKDTSGGNGEAKAIIDIAKKSGQFDITILTKTTSKDYFPSEYEFVDIVDLLKNGKIEQFMSERQFDVFLLINGTINCFGGAEQSIESDLAIYKMLHLFDKKIVFCSCDICIPFSTNIWKTIASKPWSSKYCPDEFDLSNKTFHMLTQARDLDALYNILDKKTGNVFKRENIKNFAFEKFPCENAIQHVKLNENPSYDLLYGGTLRAGRRIKKIVNWYYNHPSLNIELFGNMDQDKINAVAKKQYGDTYFKPKFNYPVNYLDNSKKMNQALATVVIGDDMYEDTSTVQQRAYESMCANVVTFIDANLDKPRNVYGSNTEFANFLYLQYPNQLEDRISKIKFDSSFRNKVLEFQQSVINFNRQEWYNDFVDKLLN
jgi:hypothetical protein